jgi:hypothetical protein
MEDQSTLPRALTGRTLFRHFRHANVRDDEREPAWPAYMPHPTDSPNPHAALTFVPMTG